jgi:SAM-dependent methyltransferase
MSEPSSAAAGTPPPAAALELRRKLMGFIVSQSIVAVTELGLVDQLADGPATVHELAAAADASPDALSRILRVLVGEGLFAQDAAGRFTLTPMGGLLQTGVPGSLRHFAQLMTGEAYQAWGAALYSARTGRPAFEQVFGKPLFDWLEDHPVESARFHEGQAGLVTLRMLPLLDRDWDAVSTVADIGGGSGALLAGLLHAHPHLRGILLDLPQVVREAERALASSGLADRVQCVGGDFSRGVPAGADVYVLAQILHDWDDEQAVAILRQCRRVLPPEGRLLILEQILPEDGQPHPAHLLDLHMMVMIGGRERTLTQWRSLLAAGGFAITGTVGQVRSALIEAQPA